MERKQYIVALEIGSSKIVGAIAEKTPTGLVSVTQVAEEKVSNCVRYGCVQNPENVKSSIIRILKDLGDRVDGKISQVYMGVSGRSLHSKNSEVNRSLDSQKSITREQINKIIHEANTQVERGYEIVDIVPRAIYVDKNRTENAVGQYGSVIKIEVTQIVAKNTLKINLDRVMNIGIPVKEYLVTALAVGKFVLTDSELSLGCMLVDMGAETTTVSIYKESALVYLGTLPMGGRNITRDVMNGMSVLEDTAERIKKNINNPLDLDKVESVMIEGVNSSEAANYISARTEEIIANIKHQIEHAGLTNDDIKSIVLLGGAAAMQGMATKIEDQTKLKVRMAEHPRTLNIYNHSINRPEYIQVFSLLAAAAERIGDNDTCLERMTYEDGPTINVPRQPEPAQPPVAEPQKKKKPSRLTSWWNNVKNFMTEPEDEM